MGITICWIGIALLLQVSHYLTHQATCRDDMLHFLIKFVNIFFSFFTFLHFLVGCTIRMYLRGFPEIQTKEDVTNISFHPTLSSTPGPPVPIHAKKSRLQNWFTLCNLKIKKECWPQQENQKKKTADLRPQVPSLISTISQFVQFALPQV